MILEEIEYREIFTKIVAGMSRQQLEEYIDRNESKIKRDNVNNRYYGWCFPSNIKTDVDDTLPFEHKEYADKMMEIYWNLVYEKYYLGE